MVRHRARARACDTGTTSRSARAARLLVAGLGIVLIAAAWRAPSAAAGTEPVTAVAAAQHAGELSSLRYGAGAQQLVEFLQPDPTSFPGRRPLVVYLHSGGWVGGDRTALNDIAAAQLARGYAVASVEYRLATTSPTGTPIASFPGAIWDVKTAIRFLKASARTLDLDPERIVLMGSSAGGHLASFVGATAGTFEPPNLPAPLRKVDSTVAAVVDIVGPTDLTTFERTPHPWAAGLTASFLGCPAPTPGAVLTCSEEALRTASVATYLDASDPPIYLAYGAEDTLVVPATQGAPLADSVGTRTPRQHRDGVVPSRRRRRSQSHPGRGRPDTRHLARHPRRPRRQALDGDGARGSRGTEQPEFESVTGERGTAVAAELDLQAGSAPFDGPEAHVFGPCDFRIGVAACEQREQPHLGVGQFERRRGAVRVLRGQCGTELRLEVGTSGGHVPDRGEERVDVGRLQRVTGRAGAQRALTEVPVGVSAIPQLGSGNPQLPGW